MNPESGASKFRVASIESSINAQEYIREKFIKETPELLKAWNFSNWHTYCDCLNLISVVLFMSGLEIHLIRSRHKEDVEAVRESFREMLAEGIYKEDLFADL